ncbi:hypothetical protein ATANTOWER_030613 [Ataeniobius toweri]|uniref:Secreted protein n=1 Tax=Ataeniobius toweri TaxID=208326 RepID=A0ABU7ABY1_9TELE|nr:hypothetical protein [Ataeniobius toweri]
MQTPHRQTPGRDLNLSSSLVVLILMLSYCLPDGICSESSWIGCEEFLTTFRALFLHRLRNRFWTEGGDTPITSFSSPHFHWQGSHENQISQCKLNFYSI